jgi:tRNA A37 threonylcarbamoyladenosine synthetase subunit TsaC/SUA5/YrdC
MGEAQPRTSHQCKITSEALKSMIMVNTDSVFALACNTIMSTPVAKLTLLIILL